MAGATMIGQTLDHYGIVAQIGEGGMGVVYRARDEVLNRDVALKLLAREALDKVGSGHLLREAQTASSLSHPNICPIHQVGQIGDDYYVVGAFRKLRFWIRTLVSAANGD